MLQQYGLIPREFWAESVLQRWAVEGKVGGTDYVVGSLCG